MLTVTVKFDVRGLGTVAVGDICSALSYLGQVSRHGTTVLLKYDHTYHEAVCYLIDPWTDWVKTATLEETEANFGHGVSTLKESRMTTNSKVLFVAPIGKKTPEDGVFDYVTIDDLSDIELVKSRSVILFRRDQANMLTTLSRDWKQYALTYLPLVDVPGGDYGPWFYDATFGLSRIAYGPFVAEVHTWVNGLPSTDL